MIQQATDIPINHQCLQSIGHQTLNCWKGELGVEFLSRRRRRPHGAKAEDEAVSGMTSWIRPAYLDDYKQELENAESGACAENLTLQLGLHPLCAWMQPQFRAVLRGTHDAGSSLAALHRESHILEFIFHFSSHGMNSITLHNARGWDPQLFLNVLIEDVAAAKISACPLRGDILQLFQSSQHLDCTNLICKLIKMNMDFTIDTLNFVDIGLRKIPELLGAVDATGDVLLQSNALEDIPPSFGMIKAGGTISLSCGLLQHCCKDAFFTFESITCHHLVLRAAYRLPSLIRDSLPSNCLKAPTPYFPNVTGIVLLPNWYNFEKMGGEVNNRGK